MHCVNRTIRLVATKEASRPSFMMAKCVVCAILLPDSTQRHCLCTSSEQVLLVTREFIKWRCPVSIRPVAVECVREMLCLSKVLFLSRVLKLRRLAEE